MKRRPSMRGAVASHPGKGCSYGLPSSISRGAKFAIARSGTKAIYHPPPTKGSLNQRRALCGGVVAMLDTVTIGVGETGIPGALALQGRGWDYHTSKTAAGKFNARASTQRAGVALYYHAGFDWVSATASLPKLLRGENDVLLPWDECEAALQLVAGVVGDAAGVELPPVSAWTFSRVDPVWAWPNDPGPYLTALRLATIPRCVPVDYMGDGMAWRTPAKRTRVRVYDKRKESGRDVELPLRVEAEVRPRKQKSVVGVAVEARVGAWEATTALGIVGGMVTRLGLDKPIVTRLQARQALIDTHGQRVGINTYRAMLDALDVGGWALLGQSPDTVNRHLRRLRGAGVSAVSPGGELAPLELPSSCPMSHVA